MKTSITHKVLTFLLMPTSDVIGVTSATITFTYFIQWKYIKRKAKWKGGKKEESWKSWAFIHHENEVIQGLAV